MRISGPGAAFALCIGAALLLADGDPTLTVGALLALGLIAKLLWRPGEPPVLLFAAAFQWAAVFAPVLLAILLGERLGGDAGLAEMTDAAWLGLIAVVVLAAGMRLGVGRRPIVTEPEVALGVSRLTPLGLATAYAVTFALAFFAIGAIGAVPGLLQLMLPLQQLRWAVVFLILWSAGREPRLRGLAAATIGIEVVIGFTGFFSGFKYVLFLALVAVATRRGGLLRVAANPAVAVLSVAIVVTLGFWQSVKSDYRALLNAGTGQQVVQVEFADQAAFLLERIANIETDDLLDGLRSGMDRIGYLEYLARSLQTVPAAIPHQDGRLWGDAIAHVLMPRILFPEKAAVNDSERVNAFTGVEVAGASAGTSISIGYVGESYIDFGVPMMFVPIVLLGVFWGRAYRWLCRASRHRMLGVAVGTNFVLSGAIQFESSNVKLLGGAVASLLVLALVLHWGGERLWALCGRSAAPSRRRGRIGASRP